MTHQLSKRLVFLVPVFATAALITVAGLYFHQDFFRILPLYVSLFVLIFSAKVNRYAFLIGGLNSILYAAVYFAYGLYGMAVYAFVFSFPIQMLSFFLWKKHAYKQSVQLRKMTVRQRILVTAGFAFVWTALYLILKSVGAAYALLDNTVSLFGILITFLQLFAYVEYTYLMLPNSLFSVALYIQMLPENPEQTTYLIYALYSLVCYIFQLINAARLYRLQHPNLTKE